RVLARRQPGERARTPSLAGRRRAGARSHEQALVRQAGARRAHGRRGQLNASELDRDGSKHNGGSMRLQSIPVGRNPPYEVNVIIEVPIGGEPIKYELDKASGILVVDRFLYTSMRYPGNYGFIPHTLSADGDPCDVLVVNTRAITPGAMLSVRPVGALFM